MGIFGWFRRTKAEKPPEQHREGLRGAEPKEEAVIPAGPVIGTVAARELSEKLRYLEPVIVCVDGERKEAPVGSRTAGKFVVCVEGESVRLFAVMYFGDGEGLAKDVRHKDIYMILSSISRSNIEGFGLVLGGGELLFDDDRKRLTAQGFSGDFGRPPKSFVEKALVLDGYSIQLLLGESASPDPRDNPAAVEWFEKRGVRTGDPWSTE